MKIKCINHKLITPKQFFLLMIAPLLIGFLITLTSLAHADWNTPSDPCLTHNPQNQGWILIESQPSKSLAKN